MNAIIPVQQSEQWEFHDLGLILNEREGHTFWKKGEIVQSQAIINGFEVLVVKHSGKAGSMYGVSINGAVIVDGCGLPYLTREEAIEAVDATRLLIGDYIDAEYSD